MLEQEQVSIFQGSVDIHITEVVTKLDQGSFKRKKMNL